MSTSLTSQLTQSLREELLNGTFPPGQQLRLNQLSQQFDVSLSPLREALSRLAAEGLVIAQDQRGYQVAPVSLRNHREITDLRIVLEPQALRSSMQYGGEEWEVQVLAAHHRLQQVERRAASDTQALLEWEARHREFHMTLIGGGQMPVLLQFCEKLLAFSDRYRRIFLRERPLDRDIPDEHEAILAATLAREHARACGLLSQHIERTAANIAILLEQWEAGERAQGDGAAA
ncbi:HTH-type transcriptional repressor CsiR [Pigmentiphaga humi]|uniref:HTH-type transcriptional repressor CsiR n=1 Tax=Pigmentiphaga humi TaxID=2478468 RepID=A0A3P4AYD5_9BURK|nr:GntR family transcriptional regulator [Pigmentiphaga humi]VCU69057.1 HTH-type transcriptional repressor CsiR [Pigmentiphaga humi]